MEKEKQILVEIDQYIEDNKIDLMKDLTEIISIPSIAGTPEPGAPFGKEVRKALDATLAAASRMGFAINDGDGYVGWAELPGEETGHIATITHLDVVPEGEGWQGDPFILRQQNGWLMGRGIGDDKGPSILCLYAAKYFKDKKIPLRYGLRVLFGCAEETGMGDVGYYLERNPQPLFCFTPDADFPVCNGEKGGLSGNLISASFAGTGNISDWQGGIASNVIPDRATCLVKADPASLQSTSQITVTGEDGLARLTAQGIGGHAARPEGTLNAIGLLVDYLLENKLAAPEEEKWLQLLQKLHTASDGSKLNINCSDAYFDPLTVIGGMVWIEEGSICQNINIRFPTSASSETLAKQLTNLAEAAGGKFITESSREPFIISAESAPIQTLLSAYSSVTGKPAQVFTMGGGTYARHFANGVSFGPREMDEKIPDFAGSEHGANEGMSIHGLLGALKIYIYALYNLQQVDFTKES